MTEKLEPDEKTIASLNASLEKCWNDAENPLPYIPLVVPPIEVPEFNLFGNGKEWHTERRMNTRHLQHLHPHPEIHYRQTERTNLTL